MEKFLSLLSDYISEILNRFHVGGGYKVLGNDHHGLISAIVNTKEVRTSCIVKTDRHDEKVKAFQSQKQIFNLVHWLRKAN